MSEAALPAVDISSDLPSGYCACFWKSLLERLPRLFLAQLIAYHTHHQLACELDNLTRRVKRKFCIRSLKKNTANLFAYLRGATVYDTLRKATAHHTRPSDYLATTYWWKRSLQRTLRNTRQGHWEALSVTWSRCCVAN